MSSALTACSKTMPVALPIGSIIARKYRIDEVIAEGGMGIVYKGWHLILEHPIAIKVVRPEYAHHPEAAARFVNEARASAQLAGIHTAHVLDLGRIENGPPVMVLEYLEGCDLRHELNTAGPLPLSRAVDYALQTCQAIAEGHSRGIIHRDLKPENLFIAQMPDGSEILKVIDFGISKRLGTVERSLTVQNQTFGSPDYMAPEQMSTPDQVDERSDIWSIGVVLFELLTNSVPFRGDTVQVTCVKVMCDEPISLRSHRPDVPVEVEEIILRCLRKLPEERYPSVKELAQDLVAYASPDHAQAFGRVRHTLEGANDDGSAFQTPGSMRVLSWHGPAVRDATPLPPSRHTSDIEQRVPMQPLWPVALSVAAAAVLLLLAFSNPQTLRAAASSAAEQVGAAARTGVRTFGIMASDTVTRLEVTNPVVDRSVECPSGSGPTNHPDAQSTPVASPAPVPATRRETAPRSGRSGSALANGDRTHVAASPTAKHSKADQNQPPEPQPDLTSEKAGASVSNQPATVGAPPKQPSTLALPVPPPTGVPEHGLLPATPSTEEGDLSTSP